MITKWEAVLSIMNGNSRLVEVELQPFRALVGPLMIEVHYA